MTACLYSISIIPTLFALCILSYVSHITFREDYIPCLKITCVFPVLFILSVIFEVSNIQYSICIKVGENDNIFNSLVSTILVLGFAIIGLVFVLIILFWSL